MIGELKVLAIRSRWGRERSESLATAISTCIVLPGDHRVVDRWAQLRARFIDRLRGDGINDLWIAACCLVHDLPLVTDNLADFQTIAGEFPGLRLVHPGL